MSWFDGRRRKESPTPSLPDESAPTTGPRRHGGAPERVTNLNFERFVTGHSRAVIDVWAPWCVPCRGFAPVFAEAAVEWGEQVGFGKLHAGHSPSLASRLEVRSIPTLLFFQNGEIVRRHVGALSAGGLRRQIRKAFRDLP